MKTIQEMIDALGGREKELRKVMTSAAQRFSEHTQATESALHNLEARMAQAQAECKTDSENAVAKAVGISNQHTEYQNVIAQVRQVVDRILPLDATIIMVSKGDDELLKLNGRNAWHFPQNERGVYAGYYPADSAEAITALEALRRKGGQYLVFPQTALWWLDHYGEFREHLDRRYRVLSGPEQVARIYSLKSVLRPRRIRKPRAAWKSAEQKKPTTRRAHSRPRSKAR